MTPSSRLPVSRLVAGLAAAATLAAGTAPLHASPTGDALKLRRLDMMLMVTSLRCRTTADDFQAGFRSFEANHTATLNGAARALRAGYVVQYGKIGADRELDRLSVAMANEYGAGHPYMSCAELKVATRDLAAATGERPLLAAADQLLASEGPRMAENAQ